MTFPKFRVETWVKSRLVEDQYLDSHYAAAAMAFALRGENKRRLTGEVLLSDYSVRRITEEEENLILYHAKQMRENG